MGPKRASTRKRQTKLAFSPLPTDSAAASSLPHQVRNRTAAVAIDGSPSVRWSKRKRARPNSDDDSETVHPFAKKSRIPKPFDIEDDDAEYRRGMELGMPVIVNKNGMFGSKDMEGYISSGTSSEDSKLESEDSESEPEPTPPPKKKDGKRPKPVESESEESELEPTSPPRKQGRHSKKEAEPEPEPQSKRKGKHAKKAKSETEESESEPASPPKKGRRGKKVKSESGESEAEPTHPPKKKGRPSKREQAMQLTPESDSEENDLPVASPSKPKRRILKGRRPPSSHESSDEDVEAVEPQPAKKGRRILRGKPKQPSPETESEEQELSKAAPKKRLRGKALQRSEDESDADGAGSGSDQELKEELAFLRSSSPPLPGRYQGSAIKEKSKRQSALEALKRKRATGSSSAVPSSQSTPGRRRAVVIDPDSDSDLSAIKEESVVDDNDLDGDDQEEDGVEGTDVEDEGSPKLSSRFEVFYRNEDDADFIDDDPEAVIGEPAEEAALPLEFTSLARAKPKELFKYAVESLVYKKISPVSQLDPEKEKLYNLAFRKLDDEVKGLANSKYSSSAWTSAFTRALRARPDIEIDEIGRQERTLMEPYCEACNRKSHPATFSIRFAGKPYNPGTLEPEEQDSTSSSDSSSESSLSESEDEGSGKKEKLDYDRHGEPIPPETKIFTVGSTCKGNAQMSHILHHWRHHLYTWIVGWLESNNYCTPELLAKRDKMSNRKREKAANKILHHMETSKETKRLYKLYKDQVDFALQEKNEFSGRWGRG